MPEKFLINNKEIPNKKEIANAFNRCYVNIGSNLNKNNNDATILPMQYMNRPNPFQIVLSNVTSKEVNDISLSLNLCSSGWDFLSTKIIQSNFNILLEPLTHVLNLSLKGIFPMELKLAKVIHLHKGNETHLVSNYRPFFSSSYIL